MRTIRFSVAVLGAMLALDWGVQAAPKLDLDRTQPVPADQQIPISDFFRPSLFDSPSFNPSGTLIAGRLTTAGEHHTLIVYNPATKTTDVASGYGDRDIVNCWWLDDTHATFNLSAEKMFYIGLFTADVSKSIRVFPILQYTGAYIIGHDLGDPLHPLVWNRHDPETNRDGGVVQVDARVAYGGFVDLLGTSGDHTHWLAVREYNDRHTVYTFPPVDTTGVVTSYMCDKDGHLAFAVTAKDGYLTLFRFEQKKWVKCPVDLDEYSILATGNRPNEMVVQRAAHAAAPAPVQFMDAVTGQPGDVLMQDAAYDFDGWFYRDPNTHEIIGANYERNGPAVKWFRAEEAEIQKLLNQAFEPGQIVQIVSRSRVGRRFIVMRYSIANRRSTTGWTSTHGRLGRSNRRAHGSIRSGCNDGK